MPFKSIDIEIGTDYSREELERKICRKLKIRNCTFTIERQSLDARDRKNIHWKIKAGVFSDEIKHGDDCFPEENLVIPYKKRKERVVVVGSGPAGFFSAYVMQNAGFNVTLIEQGRDVDRRAKDIYQFEKTGELLDTSNYAFGEGGAGTFSDGKLTSRSKNIFTEKRYIFDTYVKAGAPPEIAYLSHPHIGSDNLRIIAKSLRKEFEERGGQFLFETQMLDISLKNGFATWIDTNKGVIGGDYFVIAPGHSSYSTYRLLIRNNVKFSVKSFAIGCRVEHPQEIINLSQWGKKSVPGLKAAEYKLTYNHPDYLPVYSFCMCPGGKVVPATPESGLNIVNGMSYYKRNMPYANSGIVAGINLNDLLGRLLEPSEAIDYLKQLEIKFYEYSNSYAAPANKISDFVSNKITSSFSDTSYPFDLTPADFRSLLPTRVSESISAGMKEFTKKIKGFEDGIMMGLESKTSSTIRAEKDENGLCPGFKNLYIAGEGSGHSGGIVSSAADGIKAALNIIR